MEKEIVGVNNKNISTQNISHGTPTVIYFTHKIITAIYFCPLVYIIYISYRLSNVTPCLREGAAQHNSLAFSQQTLSLSHPHEHDERDLREYVPETHRPPTLSILSLLQLTTLLVVDHSTNPQPPSP